MRKIILITLLLIVVVVSVSAAPLIETGVKSLGKGLERNTETTVDVKGNVVETVSDNVYFNGKPVAEKNKKEANALVDSVSISDDNSTIVFHTWATNLGDSKVGVKSFVKDTVSDSLVEIKSNARFPSVSADGRYVAYEWVDDYENDLPAIYVYDLQTKKETFVEYTVGNNDVGWKTQEFLWSGNTVTYETSCGGYWHTEVFVVGGEK